MRRAGQAEFRILQVFFSRYRSPCRARSSAARPARGALELKESVRDRGPGGHLRTSAVAAMNGHGERLSRKQEQAVVALLEQPTLGQAAAAVGVNEKTLRSW